MTLSSAASPRLIRIAAALLIGPDGRTLLVRKRGTEAFMQPGGKIEAHEQPVHALARELEEELGLVIDPAHATYLGQFSAPAANEPGFVVQAELFQLTIDSARFARRRRSKRCAGSIRPPTAMSRWRH